MFDCTPCYGRDVYIDEKRVGYVERLGDGDAAITISGRNFARLTADGKIARDGKVVGEIDDGGILYFGDKEVGEVTPENDLVFYGNCL